MLTLDAIHAKVEQIDAELEHLVDELVKARDLAAGCDAAWKTALAKTRLTALDAADRAGKKQPTKDTLEDLAHRDHEDEYVAHLYAASFVENLRDALRAATTRADLMRTLAASHRAAGG